MAAAPRVLAALWFAFGSAGLNVHNTSAVGQNELATIIAMDVRLSLDPRQRDMEISALNNVAAGTDVFLCTDSAFEGDLPKFRSVVRRSLAATKFDMKQFGGWSLMKWFHLRKCWDLVRQEEEERGSNYTFVAKLRADCTKDSSQVAGGCRPTKPAARDMWRKYPHRQIGRYAFLQGEFAFGGMRPAMERIATLYDRIGSDYWGKDADYVWVDLDLVAQSDWSAAKFQWLNWPREPFGSDPCSLSKPNCFYNNIRTLKRWAAKHKWDDPEYVPTFTLKRSHEKGFTSEKVLVLDLLLGGFIIKEWRQPDPNQTKNARHGLEPARHGLEPARHGLEPARHEIEPARHEIEPARHEPAPAGRELGPARPALKPAGHEIEPARHELEPAGHQMEPGRHEMEPARREMEPARREMRRARHKMEPAGHEMEPARHEMEPAGHELEHEMEPARREMEPARREMRRARREMKRAGHEMEPSRHEMEPAGHELEPARRRAARRREKKGPQEKGEAKEIQRRKRIRWVGHASD